MDTLTFIVELVKAAAWPFSSIVIALVFRNEIRRLLTRIRKGKLGPAEFEFEEGVRELQLVVEQTPPASKNGTAAASSEQVADEPRAVVLEAWLRVEAAAEVAGKKHGHFNEQLPRDLGYVVRLLRQQGVLEQHDELIYRSLRELRNQAAHDLSFRPTLESVRTYVSLAQEMERTLRRVAGAA